MKNAVAIALLACAAVGFRTATAQSVEERFQQAIRLERVSGDFQQAIRIYRTVALDASVDREARAEAWLKMGAAYEQLGAGRAVEAYETVVSDFADASTQAEEARRRLSRLRPAEPAPSGMPEGPPRLGLRPEWQNWGIEGGDISPGGTRFVGVDPERLTVWIETPSDGSRVAVTRNIDRRGSDGEPRSPRFSPDGQSVAFGYQWKTGEEVIRIWKDGRARTVLNVSDRLGAAPGTVRSRVLDWWEGRLLVTMSAPGDNGVPAHELALVGAESGEVQVISRVSRNGNPWTKACVAASDRVAVYEDRRGPSLSLLSFSGDALFDFPEATGLFGCRVDQGEVIWSATVLERTSVQATAVRAEVGPTRVLEMIPGRIAPQFLSDSGDAVYTRGVFDGWRVLEIGLQNDDFTGLIRPLEPWGPGAPSVGVGVWSSDGTLALMGPRGVQAAIRKPGASAFEFVGLAGRSRDRAQRLRWMPDGERLVTSYFEGFTDSGLVETVIHGVRDGSEVRVPGVLSWEPTPDGLGSFYVEWEMPEGSCVWRGVFEPKSARKLWCPGVRLWNINLSVSPRGDRLAVTHQHQQSGWTVRTMSADGGDDRVLWESPARPWGPSNLYWSGDGRYLYFTAGYPETRVWKLDVETAEVTEVLTDLQGVLEMYGFSVSPDGSRAIVRARYRRLAEEDGPFVLRLPSQ